MAAELNTVERLVPTAVIARIAATEISEARKAYSISVAPDSLRRNAEVRLMTSLLTFVAFVGLSAIPPQGHVEHWPHGEDSGPLASLREPCEKKSTNAGKSSSAHRRLNPLESRRKSVPYPPIEHRLPPPPDPTGLAWPWPKATSPRPLPAGAKNVRSCLARD